MSNNTETIQLFAKVANFAAVAHVHQRRKNKTEDPYIGHPLEVANILAQNGYTYPPIVCAAMLHDVVEDTSVTLADVKREFGQEIADLVDEVSDDKSLSKGTRKRLQVEHMSKKSLMAMGLKAADKISNCSGLASDPPKSWSEQDCTDYLYWSLAVLRKGRYTAAMQKRIDEMFISFGIDLTINQDSLDAMMEAYYARCDAKDAAERAQKMEGDLKE